MFEATVEIPLNLLKVSFAGRVGTDDAKLCAKKIESLLSELQPGFRLLSDLCELETMDLGCAPFIERVMDLCDDRGIGTVVRVIPDPHKDIGLNIMSLFHYRRGVRIVTCEKMEEAEEALRRG